MQKYEIWLQLIRQEVTMAEAADQHHVDRSTIMRIRTVARDAALQALAESRPGVKTRERDWELEQAKAEAERLGEALRVTGVPALSQSTAARLVTGLLEAGIPLSLLADLSSRSGPDSAGMYRTELVHAADSR